MQCVSIIYNIGYGVDGFVGCGDIEYSIMYLSVRYMERRAISLSALLYV